MHDRVQEEEKIVSQQRPFLPPLLTGNQTTIMPLPNLQLRRNIRRSLRLVKSIQIKSKSIHHLVAIPLSLPQ